MSIVADRNDTDVLLLRARSRVDLENICSLAEEIGIAPVQEIWEDSSADYRWRARIRREDAAGLLAEITRRVFYDNFKSHVASKNPSRAALYGRVWADLLEIEQEDLV